MFERYFPFHRLGFRGNPFRTVSDSEWVALAVLPPKVAAVLDSGFSHMQLLGKKGCGKTTTLLALASHFEQSGRRVAYEYIPEGQHDFKSDSGSLDLLAIDETQRLSADERHRLLNLPPQTQLIISSHVDLANHFARRGLALSTVRLDHLNHRSAAEHLGQVIERRLNYFSLAPPSTMTLSGDAVRYLAQEFGPNLRAAEQFLYEFFQQLATQPRLASGRISAAQLQQFRSDPAGSGE